VRKEIAFILPTLTLAFAGFAFSNKAVLSNILYICRASSGPIQIAQLAHFVSRVVRVYMRESVYAVSHLFIYPFNDLLTSH
jgi:hypothetical protein